MINSLGVVERRVDARSWGLRNIASRSNSLRVSLLIGGLRTGMWGEQGSMGITMRDGDGVVPTGEVGDVGHTAGASLLTSGGQNAASLVSPEGYVIHRQSPLRDSRAEISWTRLGSSFFRDFGDGGAQCRPLGGGRGRGREGRQMGGVYNAIIYLNFNNCRVATW